MKLTTEIPKGECKLRYDCGCVLISSLLSGLSSKFLCKKHYKQVANFNATHKVIKARVVRCKARWGLIK